MKTRFDGKLWIGAFGLAIEVKDMMDELEARGVNTENIMELYTKDAAFSA